MITFYINLFKKSIVFLWHLFLIALPTGLFVFLIFSGNAKFIVFSFFILIFVLFYLFSDKLLLYYLKAREVIDSDYQTLFQYIKSVAYQYGEKAPKVYVYSGQGIRAFALASRSSWVIVLDRKLIDGLGAEELKSLVNYLFKYKKSGSAWLFTKSKYLACTLVWSLYSLFLPVKIVAPQSKGNSYVFNVLCFFTLLVIRPLLFLIELPAQGGKEVHGHYSLDSLVCLNDETEKTFDYSSFVFSHVKNAINTKEKLVKLIEGHSIFKNSTLDNVIGEISLNKERL